MKNTKKVCIDDIDLEWIKDNISVNENVFYSLFKKITDIFFGCVGFVLFVIAYFIFYLPIRIDSPGDVLFKQDRIGKDGKVFTIYKFRTLQEKNKETGELWREKNKDSVTAIGRILRKTHLDELPQAINLLAGNLSFVGPRAEWIEIARVLEQKVPFYKYRYIIKPGLFGWAQINYKASKSVEEAKEKFEYDLYYIKNKSIMLDLEILIKSVKLFFVK